MSWSDKATALALRIESYLSTIERRSPLALKLLGEAAAALRALPSHAEVEEHGQLYSGASVLVWPQDPTGKLERIAPLAQRIEAGQRFGGKVLRRRVLVVEDWVEVSRRVDRVNELDGEAEA